MFFGAVFGVLTAACFSGSVTVARRGVLLASPTEGIFFAVAAGVPLFLIVSLVSGQLSRLGEFSLVAVGMLATAGVSEFLIGRYSNFRAIDALGVNASLPLRSLNVVLAVGLAITFLGEDVNLQRGLGMGLVILAPLIMFERKGASDSGTRGSTTGEGLLDEQPFQLRQAEGYFWGLVTAFGYGIGPLFIRASVGGTGLGIAGALLSYVAATLLLLALLTAPGRLAKVRAINPHAMKWYLASAVFSFLAHMFRFLALDVAPVTVIAPLQQTSAIFTVVFSFLVNRKLELFSPRILLAIALSAVGTVILVSDL